MPAENQKTDDSFSAVVEHKGQGPETIGAAGATGAAVQPHPSDTATGLIILVILGYLLLKFLRR